jgi:pyruvate/2-oxoglutarate dehydrogenase complex dihydrolipoamide dehydrogenase (E3) component
MPDEPHYNRSHIACDVCVIGAGSAGLNVAAGAAQLGARVVLIERAEMGGECLNTGCVPSKSLIAAAHAAHTFRSAERLGIGGGDRPAVNFRKVHDHIHGVIAAIAPNDSAERFEQMGVRVLRENACFRGRNEVVAGRHRIRARRFVVATGSRASIPPVPGLQQVAPLTDETIFDLTQRPDHLLVIGGGPVGLEVAQAYRRLGSAVTVIERDKILPRDEPEAASLIRSILEREGVDLLEHSDVLSVTKSGARIGMDVHQGQSLRQVWGTHVLVATGRTPITSGIGLEHAGVKVGHQGIEVDDQLRTSNRKVYAIGDSVGGPLFTHVATYHAERVIRSALFGLPASIDYRVLPWVTYLDPEIAHVGLSEAEAREKHQAVQTVVEQLRENDRAQTERQTDGFIKLVLSKRGNVLGVTIAAPYAGEMISLWGLVISQKLSLSAVARNYSISDNVNAFEARRPQLLRTKIVQFNSANGCPSDSKRRSVRLRFGPRAASMMMAPMFPPLMQAFAALRLRLSLGIAAHPVLRRSCWRRRRPRPRPPNVETQHHPEKHRVAEELEDRIGIEKPREQGRGNHVKVDQPEGKSVEAAKRDLPGHRPQPTENERKEGPVYDGKNHMDHETGRAGGPQRVGWLERLLAEDHRANHSRGHEECFQAHHHDARDHLEHPKDDACDNTANGALT